MDLETMRTVYTVAITGSFSEAAAMIPCSQSSVSRRIKQAEDELGVPIFERHSNHEAATLTADGRLTVDTFVKILESYDDLAGRFARRSAGLMPSGPISLGVAGNTMITAIGIDSIYSDFVAAWPDIDFDIVKKTEDDLVVQVSMGKVDYALFVRYIWNGTTPFLQYECNEGLRVENFASHGLMVSVAEGSELAKRGSVRMKDLEPLEFLSPSDLHQLPSRRVAINHIVFFEACRMFGFVAKMKPLAHSSRAYREQSVASGLGSTHCALPAVMRTYTGIDYVSIEDAPIHAEFFLASRKTKDEREFAFIRDWLKSYFE